MEVVKTGIARFEFVHYSAHGATGDFAHLVSECAADQDRFWEFHDQLMSRNRNLYNQAGASAYAGTLGMDVEQFGRCLSERTHAEKIRQSLRDARALGVSFTPVLFVDGQRVQASADAVIAAAKAAAEQQAAAHAAGTIRSGRRAGVRADRNVLGDPDAKVVITEWSDYL